MEAWNPDNKSKLDTTNSPVHSLTDETCTLNGIDVESVYNQSNCTGTVQVVFMHTALSGQILVRLYDCCPCLGGSTFPSSDVTEETAWAPIISHTLGYSGSEDASSVDSDSIPECYTDEQREWYRHVYAPWIQKQDMGMDAKEATEEGLRKRKKKKKMLRNSSP